MEPTHKSDRTPLLVVAKTGQEAVVRLLMEIEGVDINTKDERG